MWFKKLTGFDEISPEFIRENIKIKDNLLVSLVNGKSYQYGSLETPTLESLKSKTPDLSSYKGKLTVKQIVGNVQQLHLLPENKNAVFQAASQFNLLEMVGPHVIPERGVDIYEDDYTQGPACAIACGAGTIYRNYFALINGQIGQSISNQIDCLDLIGDELNNRQLHLWKMSNGYALPSEKGLQHINNVLDELSPLQYKQLKNKLKIGIQWDTEVTLSVQNQIVTQVYCSALPISYTNIEATYWEKFARLILEATYEATLYAGLLNHQKTGSKKVFLTLVGGGVFGNHLDWILQSITTALEKFASTPLEINLVSYGQLNPSIEKMILNLNK